VTEQPPGAWRRTLVNNRVYLCKSSYYLLSDPNNHEWMSSRGRRGGERREGGRKGGDFVVDSGFAVFPRCCSSTSLFIVSKKAHPLGEFFLSVFVLFSFATARTRKKFECGEGLDLGLGFCFFIVLL